MDTRSRSSLWVFLMVDLVILYCCFLWSFAHYKPGEPLPLVTLLFMALLTAAWIAITINSPVSKLSGQSDLARVFKWSFAGYSMLMAVTIAAVGIFGDFTWDNKLILYPFLFAGAMSTTLRLCYVMIAKHLLRNGYNQKSLLVIGCDNVADRVVDLVLRNPGLGYKMYGVLADECYESLPKGLYLGATKRFKEIVRIGVVDEVIVALPLRLEEKIKCIVEQCEHEGIRVRIVPDFFRIIKNRAVQESLGDVPLIGIRTEPLSYSTNQAMKRAFDVFFALGVLIVLSPVFLVLALLVKFSSPGPVFFAQERVGANNRKFMMFKFRSMRVQEKKESDTVWTREEDPRVTRIGRFMRKTSLDELPQFFNVLRGDMSVVGPRPEREHFVEQFRKDIPYYKVRHLAKSGITGWAQVNGWRGDTSIEKRVECDIEYIENWSLWLDIRIIVLTLFGKETRRHAY